MSATQGETRRVVVEREFPHPPERVWRALTQPELLSDWLMPNDFRAEPDRAFRFRAEWGGVDCKVLEVRPMHRLSYSWSAFDVDTIVTFTLRPTASGTHLRMEQTGFRPDQKQALGGATGGWAAFFEKLERTLRKT